MRGFTALSTPKVSNFPALHVDVLRRTRPMRPVPTRTPHWRHIPPALFASGKGQWSRHESESVWAWCVDAPEVALHRAGCVPLIWPGEA